MRLRSSKRRGSSALVVLGIGLAVYVGVAATYHSFVEPALAKRAAVLPTVALAQTVPAPQAASDLQPLPAHFAAKPRPVVAPPTPPRAAATATAATTTDGNSTVEPKKPARRQASRDYPRQDRGWGGGSWGGGWGNWGGRNFASGPSNGGSRPWF